MSAAADRLPTPLITRACRCGASASVVGGTDEELRAFMGWIYRHAGCRPAGRGPLQGVHEVLLADAELTRFTVGPDEQHATMCRALAAQAMGMQSGAVADSDETLRDLGFDPPEAFFSDLARRIAALGSSTRRATG